MPPPRPRRAPETQRNIYFFRADAGADSAGRPLPLILDADLERLNALGFVSTNGRYQDRPDGDVLCGWVDRATAPQRMRLATVRRSALPSVERAGQLSPLALQRGGGLYEPIHIVFFPNNIVGVEFNFYGPRPTRIPLYLEATLGSLTTPFVLEALLRQDAADELDRMKSLRILDLKMRASFATQLQEMDESLGESLRLAAETGGATYVGLYLQPEPYSRREHLKQSVLDIARRLARRPDIRENIRTFKVRGTVEVDGVDRITEIDLLSDQLVATKRVVRTSARDRTISQDAAYTAISEAYAELRLQLERAASVAFANRQEGAGSL